VTAPSVEFSTGTTPKSARRCSTSVKTSAIDSAGVSVGAGAEDLARGRVGERALRPEEGHGEAGLERARRGDDLAEDRPDEIVGERSLVERAQPLEDPLLAARHPKAVGARGTAGAPSRLALADALRDPRAVAQQAEDALVDPVDLGALTIDQRISRALPCHVGRVLQSRESYRTALGFAIERRRRMPRAGGALRASTWAPS
jgi:hypothetical protein